jgi:hypothetical protein
MTEVAIISAAALFAVVFFTAGVRLVRPTTRGLVVRLGKYHRTAMPGLSWIVPLVEQLVTVSVTEVAANKGPQGGPHRRLAQGVGESGNARTLERLTTLAHALSHNTKLVVPSNGDLGTFVEPHP